MVEYSEGDRVIRKSNGISGVFVEQVGKRIAKVRWDETQAVTSLPIEELRAWDRQEAPVFAKATAPRTQKRGNAKQIIQAARERQQDHGDYERIYGNRRAKLKPGHTEASLRTPADWEAILPITRYLFSSKEEGVRNVAFQKTA